MPLVFASTPRLTAPFRFTWDVPDGWQQGRGTFGGLVLAAIARTLVNCDTSEGASDRTLRSFLATIPAPVVANKPATIGVRVVREGNNVTTLAATLAQEGEVRAEATAIFGKKRIPGQVWAHDAPKLSTSWRDVPVAPVEPPLAPVFTSFFEFRLTGPAPFSSHHEAITEGWVRPRTPLTEFGPAEAIALVDTFWPAAFVMESGPRPTATIAFTCQYFEGRVTDPSAPLFYRARASAAQDGYVAETRELWTEEGALVARNEQTFVWIK